MKSRHRKSRKIVDDEQSSSGRRSGRVTLSQRRRVPPGSMPGLIVPDPELPRPHITLQLIGESGVSRPEQVHDLSALKSRCDGHTLAWVHVGGHGDAEALAAVGDVFGLHRLSLEDVVNTCHRPKIENFGSYTFVVAHFVTLGDELSAEQLSIFFGKGFVLSILERPGSQLDQARVRLERAHIRGRVMSADTLAYILMDMVVDNYFPVLEHYGERIESLEDEVFEYSDQRMLARIRDLRRDLLLLRRMAWPLRDAVSLLLRDPGSHFSDDNRPYLRDLYDHLAHIIDLLENYREVAHGLTELYLSGINLRMNEVMKVLTIIATIFIPLSFVASVYGMNFDREASPYNMPELGWALGYPFAIALMALVAGVMMYYFWRSGWLGGEGARRRRLERQKRSQSWLEELEDSAGK